MGSTYMPTWSALPRVAHPRQGIGPAQLQFLFFSFLFSFGSFLFAFFINLIFRNYTKIKAWTFSIMNNFTKKIKI
jgi:hypothetical protein